MNSSELRQSFLDFFKSKQHQIVPSASLMPTSPGLLFTNAGMNQFVPYFLGEQKAPWPRAADTQKCIRAGGKHNDLEDVGFDTYHHTFFEMLGNWSFGDYFKKEAIHWAWELLTQVWGLPAERLYATVYKPGEGDPADFDQEAWDYWAEIFRNAGLDPEVHIVNGNKKDNFWMMGDTGPCGPCSEIHMDLTPNGDTQGALVNMDSPLCIEIWNLVFIQFNANEDGTYSPLSAKHVDTGMGFERVAGIMATTKNFTDFSRPPSNYDSDLFGDIFAHLQTLSGKAYTGTLPESDTALEGQALTDVVYRVLADHIRTLSFSVADGILPGNEGRNYVLRRILRRAVMWGKRLDLPSGFFAGMANVLIDKMSPFFPELADNREMITKVLANEESAFERTLERGLKILEEKLADGATQLAGQDAFILYDTYGFPLDLTQLLCRERKVEVDLAGFETEMNKQREQARAAQKKTVIKVDESAGDTEGTVFVGYEQDALKGVTATVTDIIQSNGKTYIATDRTAAYAEMGGQVGDAGEIHYESGQIIFSDTIKGPAGRYLHEVAEGSSLSAGDEITIHVHEERRRAIQRHHTATHLLHWALRKVLGNHVKQAGSYVGPDRLRFDFSHFEAMNDKQLAEVERLVNECVIHNDRVNWYEVSMDNKPDDVVAFFGDKYGAEVRIVEVGGTLKLKRNTQKGGVVTYEPQLETRKPGYSAELCGGTHVRATGEIGLFKIVGESAIAAGTRRLEAVCGMEAYRLASQRMHQFYELSKSLNCQPDELPARLDTLITQRAQLERELKKIQQQGAAAQAGDLATQAQERDGLKWVIAQVQVDDPNALRSMGADTLNKLGDNGVVVLGAELGKKVSIAALCSQGANDAGIKAGDLIRDLAGKLGGKGGGKPDFAMGGAANDGKLAEALKSI